MTIQRTGSHDWELVEYVEESCGTPGVKYYKCKNGNSTKKVVIKPNGAHVFETKVEEPGCGKPGKKVEVCKNCGFIGHGEDIPPSTEHHLVLTEEECVPASETECGVSVYVCTICGVKLRYNTKHNMDDWVTVVKPNCKTGSNGKEMRKCLDEGCVYQETREIAYNGHIPYDSGAPRKDDSNPYFYDAKKHDVKCSLCGEVIQAEHVFEPYVVPGTAEVINICTVCGVRTYTVEHNSHVHQKAAIPEHVFRVERIYYTADKPFDSSDVYKDGLILYPHDSINIYRYKCCYDGCDEYFDVYWLKAGTSLLVETPASVLFNAVFSDINGFIDGKAGDEEVVGGFVAKIFTAGNIIRRVAEYAIMVKDVVDGELHPVNVIYTDYKELFDIGQSKEKTDAINDLTSNNVINTTTTFTSFNEFADYDYSNLLVVYDFDGE